MDKGFTVSFRGMVSRAGFFFAGVDDEDGAEFDEVAEVSSVDSVGTAEFVAVSEEVVDDDDAASDEASFGSEPSLSSLLPSFDPKKPLILSGIALRRTLIY